MLKTQEIWSVPAEARLAIIDLALSHIKKVQLDPEVETDGDNFDYWNSYKLEDGTYIDYNIYCGDEVCEVKQDGSGEYEYTDPSTWSWDVACYAVNPPTEDNPYYQIDTDREQYLFSYNKKGNRELEFENEGRVNEFVR